MEHPMTVKGYQTLQNELEKLIKVEREEIKQAIQEARELGDLKENAEYHSAKEKQAQIEGRIMEIQGKIAHAKVIDLSTVKSDRIVFGAIVTLFDEEKDLSLTYQIVGEDEAKTDPKKISYLSPIARALIGKSQGDDVVVKAPKGDIYYQVEKVEYQQ
mgnify:CR=1 FL=1